MKNNPFAHDPEVDKTIERGRALIATNGRFFANQWSDAAREASAAARHASAAAHTEIGHMRARNAHVTASHAHMEAAGDAENEKQHLFHLQESAQHDKQASEHSSTAANVAAARWRARQLSQKKNNL